MATFSSPSAEVLNLPRVKSRSRYFFPVLSILMIAVVFTGFWPSYFGPLITQGRVVRPLIIHLHGAIFLGWMALYRAGHSCCYWKGSRPSKARNAWHRVWLVGGGNGPDCGVRRTCSSRSGGRVGCRSRCRIPSDSDRRYGSVRRFLWSRDRLPPET